MKLRAIFLVVVFLGIGIVFGCAVPGSYLPLGDKKIEPITKEYEDTMKEQSVSEEKTEVSADQKNKDTDYIGLKNTPGVVTTSSIIRGYPRESNLSVRVESSGRRVSGSADTEEAQTEEDISEKVVVHPLTTSNIKEFKNTETISRANPDLDKKLANYKYYIGPGDILNVTVWDHPELTIPAGSYRSASDAGNWVHADGTIFYPYIGEVSVVGRTVIDVRDEVAQRLKRYIKSPQVDVNVAAFRSQKVYMTGEVNNPGQQSITNVPLTLLDGVNKAGGLTSDADWRNISLTREGKKEIISLYALMQQGDLMENRLLQSGDIVHIPRNDNQKVFVMGEVNEPQLLKIDRVGMSLTEALSAAGGINQLDADATGVFVIRGIQNNLQREQQAVANVYQLNIKDASALIIGTEFPLRPYDVVYVTAAPITRWDRVLRKIVPTITGFNDLSEGMLRIKNWP